MARKRPAIKQKHSHLSKKHSSSAASKKKAVSDAIKSVATKGSKKYFPTVSPKKRQKWSESDMLEAIRLVKEENYKCRTAAHLKNVPKSSLDRRLHEKCTVEKVMGRRPVLSAAQEKDLAQNLIHSAK